MGRWFGFGIFILDQNQGFASASEAVGFEVVTVVLIATAELIGTTFNHSSCNKFLKNVVIVFFKKKPKDIFW